MTQTKQHSFSSHGVGDSHYTHQGEGSSWKVLGVAVALTVGFAGVEVVGGLLSNSLALISDAGHMVTDAFSLFFALVANCLSRGAASNRFSFGFAKVEVIASFINGLLMFAVVGWIVFEAVERFTAPVPVAGASVVAVAAIGLAVNVIVAYVLSRDDKSLNTRAALVHVMGDLLGSLAAIAGGAIIWAGGPVIIDPALSIFVSLLILKSTFGIIGTSVRQLMDAVPEGIPYDKVGQEIGEIKDVLEVHDLHIWDMSPNEIALQAHLTIASLESWSSILREARAKLREHYGITHVTLQPELPAEAHHAENTHDAGAEKA